MKKSRFSEQQIAFVLRQAEEGTAVAEVCRKAGISEATYYSWRKRYGGLMPSEMKRLKQLEEENAKLKRIVADLSLDKEMLQGVIKRKLWGLRGGASWSTRSEERGRSRSVWLALSFRPSAPATMTRRGAARRPHCRSGSRRLRRRGCVTAIVASMCCCAGRAGW